VRITIWLWKDVVPPEKLGEFEGSVVSLPGMLDLSMHFFLQMAVILAVCRLLWPLFKRLGQVQVVAIMVAGFVLGPSLLGLIWPDGQNWLFPTKITVGGVSVAHPSLTIIYAVGQLGLVVYMFLVGASFKVDIFKGHIRHAAATSVAGIGAPLVLGLTVGWIMVTGGGDYYPSKVQPWQGALFLAAAICITAFPMLAWIVYDSGLLNTRLGTMALACAAADDAFAWIMLATVVATTKGSAVGAVLAVVGGLFYLVLMLTVGKAGLKRLSSWADRRPEDGLPIGPLVVTLLVVMVGAWFTDFVGIYSVFGAFIAGTVMPRGRLLDTMRQRLEPLTAYLLLPAFFIYSGLNTQLSLLFEPSVLIMMGIVLLISFVAKFGSVTLAARSQGMSWNESASLGSLMNARGLMELILLNIGLTAGFVNPTLYTILAIMTIVTTFAATPLHHVFERRLARKGLVFGAHGEEPPAPAVVVHKPALTPVPATAEVG